MEKIVFIDRDGVINKDLWKYVEHPEEFIFEDQALNGLKSLTQAGYYIVIISNQAGIGDGVFTKEALQEVNQRMIDEARAHGAEIRKAFYCEHGKQEGCSCRKPEPGLFYQAEGEIPPFDKKHTYYIGDKISDIQAGIRYGLRTIMVLTGYGVRDKEKITSEVKPNYIARDLQHAAEYIINEGENA